MAFKMKGFPAINSKGYSNMKDGRSKSAAFQKNGFDEETKKKITEGVMEGAITGMMGSSPKKPTKPLKKDDIVEKNKQKQFNKKVNDLRGQWRNLKDRNSNKAKQLKKEASKIGLALDESFSTKNTHAGH